jgi:hypothetical protein
MNKTDRVASAVVDIVLHGVQATRNQLHYAPVITLVVDTLTHVILNFSIQKKFEHKYYRNSFHENKTLLANSFSKGSTYSFSEARDYYIDNAPEYRITSLASDFKELTAQPCLTFRNPVKGAVEVHFTQIDIILPPSRPLWRQAHPSPKNPPFGEAWRHGGGHLPRG